MSRAHTQGYDSNPGQFERMGNPWHGEPVLKRRGKKRGHKARPECRPGLPRLIERDSRDGDEQFESTRFWLDFDQRRKAMRGTSRTVVADEKSPTLAKIVETHRHPSRTELTGWQKFERQCVRVVQRAAVAERAAKAAAIDEREQLARRIVGLQQRLAELG